MGNVKGKDKKKYSDMWGKAAGVVEKKKSKPLTPGKVQALIESMGWDQTSKGNDCIKVVMKALTGPDQGRTMYRTFYIQGDNNDYGTAEENTAVNINKFKAELGKLGVSALKTPDEAMESLEDCVIEVSIWQNPKNKEKYPVIYLNKFIKGPESSEPEPEAETVVEEAPVEEVKTKIEEPAAETVTVVDDGDDDVEY